jgi:peptide-methionine (R)-S-oxide reductase
MAGGARTTLVNMTVPASMGSALTRRRLLVSAALLGALTGCSSFARADPPRNSTEHFDVTHTDAEWRTLLDAEQYDVLRNAGTETPFSSPLNDEHRTGVFRCAGCGLRLFSSTTKFDSGTGWPSFWQPLDNAVIERDDDSLGVTRTEVLCRQCGGHLGHVFDDGPRPTGLRYCMNGAAMTFLAT